MRLKFVSFFASATLCLRGVAGSASAACPTLPYPAISAGSVADANQVMANFNSLASCQNSGPSGPVNSIQYNNGSATLAGVGPLSNGQVIVGSTGSPPQAATLTPGAGVTIANAPGSVTLSAPNIGANYLREFGTYAPPNASSFTHFDTPIAGVSPAVANISNVGLQYYVNTTSDNKAYPGAYRNVPSLSSWTLTLRAKATAIPLSSGGNPSFGVWVQDTLGKMVGFLIVDSNSLNLAHVPSDYALPDILGNSIGVLEVPTWFRVHYASAVLSFYVSWDGQNWMGVYTEPQSGYLNGTLKYIGIGGNVMSNLGTVGGSSGVAGAVITYWDIDDDPASTRQIQ